MTVAQQAQQLQEELAKVYDDRVSYLVEKSELPDTPQYAIKLAGTLLFNAAVVCKSIDSSIVGARGAVEYVQSLAHSADGLLARALAFDPDRDASGNEEPVAGSVAGLKVDETASRELAGDPADDLVHLVLGDVELSGTVVEGGHSDSLVVRDGSTRVGAGSSVSSGAELPVGKSVPPSGGGIGQEGRS